MQPTVGIVKFNLYVDIALTCSRRQARLSIAAAFNFFLKFRPAADLVKYTAAFHYYIGKA